MSLTNLKYLYRLTNKFKCNNKIDETRIYLSLIFIVSILNMV